MSRCVLGNFQLPSHRPMCCRCFLAFEHSVDAVGLVTQSETLPKMRAAIGAL